MSSGPLCPALYNRLKAVFGGVMIANQGEELTAVRTPDEVGRPRTRVINSGEYYRVNCPFCNDTRKRMWVNYRFAEYPWLAHCFNETYCLAGGDGRARRQRVQQWLFDTVRPVKLATEQGTVVDEATVGPVDLPGDVEMVNRLPFDHPARRYLLDRGYDLDYLANTFGVGFVERVYDPTQYRPLEGRIFIPIIMEGELVGWQGRWPADLKWKEVRMPKYYNLRHMAKRKMLYNFDQARRYPTVVLTEGVTDVWSVGPMAVSLLGSELTGAQRDMVVTTWRGGTVVVLLDGDAVDNNQVMTRELADEFQKSGGRVLSVPLPPDKDPGDLSTQAVWEFIHYAAARTGVPIDLQPRG